MSSFSLDYPFKPAAHVIEMTVGGSCFVPPCPTPHHILFHFFKSHTATSHVPLDPPVPTTSMSHISPATTLPIQLISTNESNPDILPLSSRLIKPRKPHAGQKISQNPLCPHISAADRLFTWDTPHAAHHRQHLIASIPPDLVNSTMMSIHGAYAPNTKTTYAASTLCFTQFCDTWHIDEEAWMPASYPLLCAVIGEHKGRQAGNTICSWLSGIHAWHVVNHAPWFGDDKWVHLAQVSANKEGTKHRCSLRAPVSIEHLLALRHALNISTPFHVAVWALACVHFLVADG